jgi:hypothetical protein
MPDLHGWITQQIDHVERALRDVDKEHGRNWTTQWNASSDTFTIYDDSESAVASDALPAAASLIASHDPAAVLRRCAADRKILTIHAPQGGDWEPYACQGCGSDSEYGVLVDHTNDCETLQALAEGYGLTEEQRAALDRPEPAPRQQRMGGFLMSDAIAESFASFWLGTRPVEPRPEARALEILAPELKKIPGYIPVAEE